MANSPLSSSRRREQGARTRDRVLDMTTELMAQRGYSGTTISAISKASGVLPASIYWHFESKEGLLAAVIERAAEVWFFESTAAMAEGEDSELGPDFAGLHDPFRDQPNLYRALLLLALERNEADDASLAVVKRVRERYKRFIADLIAKRGSLDDTPERRELCARMAALALVLIDGTFVAHQIDGAQPAKLRERVESIAWVMRLAHQAWAEEIRSLGEAPGGDSASTSGEAAP